MWELFRASRRAIRRDGERRRLREQLERIAAAQALLEFRLAVTCWERAGNPRALRAPVAAVNRLQKRRQRLQERNESRRQALEELRRERERLDARREGQISRLAEEISSLEQRRGRAERMLEHCDFQREKLRDQIAALDREDVQVIKRLQQLQESGNPGTPRYAEESGPEDADQGDGATAGKSWEDQEKQELEARRQAIPEEQEELERQAQALDPEIEKCRREQDVTYERLLALERTRKAALRGYLRRELHLTRREEQLRRDLLHHTRYITRMELQNFPAFQQVGAYLAEKGMGSEEQKHVLPGILALRAETEEIQNRLQEIQEEAGRDAHTWTNLRLWLLFLFISALALFAGAYAFFS